MMKEEKKEKRGEEEEEGGGERREGKGSLVEGCERKIWYHTNSWWREPWGEIDSIIGNF